MQASAASQLNAHEQLLEKLSTILLQISSLQALAGAEALDIEALRNGLLALEQTTRATIYEIRSAHDDLPLADLVGVSLAEALSHAVEETAEVLGLSSRVSFAGEERPLPNYGERLLYRIAQETLYQVQQHSSARKLRFAFNYGREEVQMSIEDDGTLLESEEETPVPHFSYRDNGHAGEDGHNELRPYIDLRHRIEHLGGSLDISTDIEKGTRVEARMPYTISHSSEHQSYTLASVLENPGNRQSHPYNTTSNNITAAATSAPMNISPPTKYVRVLVVDNQSVSRAGLRRLLESYADLQVIGEAADGVQAVSETLELGPQVVLLDAHLPDGQSLEALKQIKQLNLNTRVLLLSAQQREEYLYETLRAGADGYVLKDIAPDELAQAVRIVASGEVLVQSQLAGRLLSRVGKQGRGGFPYETLTAREQEVLQLLARGLRNKEIAARLHVSERTVNFHLANIYQKLNVSGRTEALSKAHEQGMITT